MSRRYFKKNVDQKDLFDLASQLYEIKNLDQWRQKLSMVSWLKQAELDLIETKKKSVSGWVQVSIFDDL
jgi:hypothetical protein